MNSLIAIVLSSAIIVAVYCQQQSAHEQNLIKELTAAGVSQETADGIIAIGQKHKDDGAKESETGKTIFEAILRETDEYLKGRPEADQQAYANFVAEQKAKFERPDEIGSSNADSAGNDSDSDDGADAENDE